MTAFSKKRTSVSIPPECDEPGYINQAVNFHAVLYHRQVCLANACRIVGGGAGNESPSIARAFVIPKCLLTPRECIVWIMPMHVDV